MRHILTSVVLVVFLFPSLASGETMEDLVEREGIHYKKLTDVPFTGEVTGQYQGFFERGLRYGPWVWYYDNGRIEKKGTYKDGKLDGPWVGYSSDGTVQEQWTGTFKEGEKVK